MGKNNFTIRRMERKELDLAIEWAADEGWNPGLHDADCFYQSDPNGFFIGLINEKPISCISAVAYDKHFGFLGFYIVRPEYRGQGFGWKTWMRGISYLKTQNIGLDGVVAQQENYKKSGFKLAYRNIRFQGKSRKNREISPEITSLSKINFEEILKYDSLLFPTARPQFFKRWIKLPESQALGYVNKEKIKGYGVIRKCRKGYKIGPLFADNGEIAETLFRQLNNKIESGAEIFLDIPEVNPAALKLAQKHQMKKVFETARMYTKKAPEVFIDKIFGVTTFELG